MSSNSRSVAAATFLGALVLVGQSALASKPAKTAAASPAAAPAQAAPPEMSAEDATAMAACQAAGTPGEMHAKLAPLAGSFKAANKMWMKPGAVPEESTGTAQARWVLGNRFLEQTYTGTVMGMPFEGRGITGYDNVQKKYVGSWIDGMSTGIMTSTGSWDDTAKVINFAAKMWDPISGKESTMREVVRIESTDKHVFEMYINDPASGKEYLMMEITYTREGKLPSN